MKNQQNRIGTTEHRYVEERLSAYLDGELSPRERKAVRQHLTTCQTCQWNLATLQQTVQWTQALPKVPPPRVFTISAPSRPVPAPRRRWGFAPVLQGATALVALLLVVVLAGDFLLGGLQPASMPLQTDMLEEAPAAVQVTAIVQEVEKALPVEEEAAAEVPASEPALASTPLMGTLTAEPALGIAEQPLAAADREADEGVRAAAKAVTTPTAAPEGEQAQLMAIEPPSLEESEAMATGEAVEALATPPAEATPLEGAGAAEAGGAATATAAPLPTAALLPTEAPPSVVPTTVVQVPAPAPIVPEAQEGKPAGVLRQPSANPLRSLEVGLVILVVLLGTLALVATALQRRPR